MIIFTDIYGKESQNKEYDEILKELEESRKYKTNMEEKLFVEKQLFTETLRKERAKADELQKRVKELELEIVKLNEVKTKNDQELINRIKEVQDNSTNANNSIESNLKEDIKAQNEKIKKATKDIADLKKEKNSLTKKNKILEDTIKEGFLELDKQVQLKEQYAEEKKVLAEIIKTHKVLQG